MTIAKGWIYAGVLLVLLVLGLGVYELVREHDARVKAEAAVAATQKNFDEAVRARREHRPPVFND